MKVTTDPTWRVLLGDVLERMREIPDGSVQTCVTSPPYWGLRDYGAEGQLGLEETPLEYVTSMVEVFRQVRRTLTEDGTLWLNLGDSYAGSFGAQGRQGQTGALAGRGAMAARQIAAAAKGVRLRADRPAKSLLGLPWRVALALQDDGWLLRSDIIWSKPNPMPESVGDRPTRAHEYVFLFARSGRYHYDADAIRAPLREKTFTTYGTTRRSKGTDRLGRVASANWARDVPVRAPRLGEDGEPVGANKRTVWTIPGQPTPWAHFATMPEELARTCVLAGSRQRDMVLDPFSGSGTTGVVALRLGRSFVGCEINPEYAAISERRLSDVAPLLIAGAVAS